jgi:hypothetical protein
MIIVLENINSNAQNRLSLKKKKKKKTIPTPWKKIEKKIPHFGI